tara:strand:- start:718 stop:912 length:195 start_codon:yes stop_codon:yes gene_type:complete
MKPSEVLKQLKELKETWRKQGFSYTMEQQAEYERLRQLRYKRVAYFHENDLVWKGLSKQVDVSK